MTSYSKGDVSATFTYDADGLRGSKTVNGSKTTYFYVGDQLMYECRGDGIELYFYYDSYGNLSVIRYVNGTNSYYHYVTTNSQGDVLGIYSASDDLKASYEYDTWGNCTIVSDTSGINIATVNPIRYRGYYYDSETGFYYLQSRYYCPKIGRFLNADGYVTTDAVEPLTYNMFAYCGNNPVNNIDPSGTCFYGANGQWCHDNWEFLDGYVRKPDTGYYQGTTTSGKNVYIAQHDNYSCSGGSIKIKDFRDVSVDKETGAPNPNYVILNSYRITTNSEQMEIIAIIQKYDGAVVAKNTWNRTTDSMVIEWDAHNDIYNFYPNERCKHVDLDNGDEVLSYIDYWQKAAIAKLEEWEIIKG